MIRLCVGHLEEDLADCFGVYPYTIPGHLLHRFKSIPLWPSKAQIQQCMPQCFRRKYPSTRVTLDAIEVKVVQPSDSIEQQVIFSHYKNTNTF